MESKLQLFLRSVQVIAPETNAFECTYVTELFMLQCNESWRRLNETLPLGKYNVCWLCLKVGMICDSFLIYNKTIISISITPPPLASSSTTISLSSLNLNPKYCGDAFDSGGDRDIESTDSSKVLNLSPFLNLHEIKRILRGQRDSR
ncbi:hypothetical protein L2E82_05676 [Cichorium intybus]|uniref:Uncharacterized protein n=1 Tax=Cichorium intybus TaxID=13427 RepID=A0ACB9H7H5_CICIN|nr:hypothetical protein L2E82_05676 [Cichorium intybus]